MTCHLGMAYLVLTSDMSSEDGMLGATSDVSSDDGIVSVDW